MKTKDILWWIVAILILGFAVVFFGSCENTNNMNKPYYYTQYQKLIMNGDAFYKFVDDTGCLFMTDNSTEILLHHPTCNNPKHSCACYNEVYE